MMNINGPVCWFCDSTEELSPRPNRCGWECRACFECREVDEADYEYQERIRSAEEGFDD